MNDSRVLGLTDRSVRFDDRNIIECECKAVEIGRIFLKLIYVGQNVRRRCIDDIKKKSDIFLLESPWRRSINNASGHNKQ